MRDATCDYAGHTGGCLVDELRSCTNPAVKMQAHEQTIENVVDAPTVESMQERDSLCEVIPEDLRRALATRSPMHDPPGVHRCYVILTCPS